MSLLAASRIHKTFAGVRALRGLSFELAAAEVHALVGENGAGKSTFVRIITGAEVADSGTIEIGGESVTALTPAAARARGIAVIHQHPSLFPDLTVAENIAWTVERRPLWSVIDHRERRDRARALLARVGASIDPDRLVATLSLPEQQLVEIAKAIGTDARVVVMDEPTASLTGREVDHLFEVIARLKTAGTGVIYISHRLEEIQRIADRLTVVRDGETVAAGLPARSRIGDIVGLMVGRTLADAAARRGEPRDAVLFDVRRVSSREGGLTDVSFTVREGEILGVAGLVGSGRTALAEALFGLRRIDDGEVRLRGVPLVVRSVAAAVRAGIAYLPEDRRRHGVIADLPVADNTSLASLARLSRAGLVRRREEARLARSFVERFAIRTPSIRAAAGTLSGGNQQKVALARWLATDPAVLILDEPTQGVDVASKAEIHALIREMAAEGRAVVLISSELPEILAMSDRIAVMVRGTLAAIIGRAGATEAEILSLALGQGADAASDSASDLPGAERGD